MEQSFCSETHLILPDAARTLQRLCRHFSHRVHAQWKEGSGCVEFAEGACRLISEADLLVIKCSARSPEDLRDIELTFERHVPQMTGAVNASPVIVWQR